MEGAQLGRGREINYLIFLKSTNLESDAFIAGISRINPVTIPKTFPNRSLILKAR